MGAQQDEAIALFGGEQVERARGYHRPLYAALLGGLALELVLLALVAFGAPGHWLFSPLRHWPWWAQVLAFTALLDGLGALAALPLSFWAGFLRERRYGFSTQRLGGWAADRAKAFAIDLAVSAAALLALVGCARRFPRAWPALAAPGAALALLALAGLGPLLVEPLFNRFVPLADTELAAGLRALAARALLPLEQVLVADASKRTRKANAYVSGLGATRRLVLYDTLLERAARAELELITAHELGHRRAGHVRKGVAVGMLAVAGLIVVLWALLRSRWLREALSAPRGAADPRVVAFVMFAGAAAETLAAPLMAALSRRFEREADRFSLELTGDLAAFESAHRALAAANLADLDPPRALYLAFFSHPTPAERIAAARRLAGAG